MMENIKAREDLVAPLPCGLCWSNPVSEDGALCADCIFREKIENSVSTDNVEDC